MIIHCWSILTFKKRLLTIITGIVDYLKGKIKSISSHLNSLINNQLQVHSGSTDKANKPRPSRAHKNKNGLSPEDNDYILDFPDLDNEDSNNEEAVKEKSLLTRKRLRPRKDKVNYFEIEEAKLFSDESYQEEEEGEEVDGEEKEAEDKCDMLKKYNFDLIKKAAVTEDDKDLFNQLDEVVKEFEENFPEHSKEFIIDALKSNSLNLKNTYLYLKDPEAMKGIL